MGLMRMNHMIVATLLLATACSVSMARNLVLNPGFEAVGADDMPENWGVHAWTVEPVAEATTRRGGASGERCLAIKLAGGQAVFGVFSRAIDVSDLETDRLLLSYRYRVDGAPNAQAMVVSFNEDFMRAQWETRPLASEARAFWPAQRWSTATWLAELRPTTRQVVVVFQVLSPGTLFVDDVVLRAYPDEIEAEQVEVGRVAALPDTRRATLRLVNRAPGVARTKLTLTALRERRSAQRVVTDVDLESNRPKDVDVRYRFPAAEAHQVELLLTDARTDEVLWFRHVDVPGLIDAQMDEPAFRGTIMSTQSVPEIIISGRLFAVPGLRDQVQLYARLMGTGAEATEGKGIRRAEEGAFRIVLPAEGLLIGEHQVRIDANIGSSRAASGSLPVRRTRPRDSEVTYDRDHRLWVEGNQIFPIGIFNIMEPEDLDIVKEAGFNTVVVPSPRASYLLADSAAAKGIGLVVASPSTRKDFWVMREQKFGNHPALVAWEVVQRPDAKAIHPDVMLALYQILTEVSPTHPVATTLVYPDSMREYARATDIIIPWDLPVPQLPITRIADVVSNAREATGGRKPVWALIQATGNAWATDNTMDDTAEGRLPTIAEVRALAYLALVHGADGLMFYAYNIIQSASQRSFRIQRDAPDLWEGIGRLNRELAALAPVVGARPGRVPLPPAADGLVHMTRWPYDDRDFIIAVNTGDLPTVTSFTIPDCPATVLELPFEDRMLTSERPGAFSDVFEPYGVHVYVIKR